MDRHRVTILVCTHDDGPTLGEALESALVQTAPRSDYRVLVVDDASTDDTPQVLRRFGPAGVEVVRLPVNAGLAGACNAGLERIATPSFVRLDGDDVLLPDAVEALLERADETGADIVSCDRWEEHPAGRRLRVLTEPPEVRDLVAAGTLLPTALVRAVGGYRPLFWEEYDLYLRLLEDADCVQAHVPRPLYVYRVGHAGAMTGDAGAVEEGWRELRGQWPEETLAQYGLGEERTTVRYGA
jgi:glycosyltransferase involved in cell wall biosynthesis